MFLLYMNRSKNKIPDTKILGFIPMAQMSVPTHFDVILYTRNSFTNTISKFIVFNGCKIPIFNFHKNKPTYFCYGWYQC